MFPKISIAKITAAILIMLFLLTSTLPVQAEPLARPLFANGDFIWARNMGGPSFEQSKGIAIDSNGNVYTTGAFQTVGTGPADFDPGPNIAGFTSSGVAYDIFVSKLDSNGNYVWAKKFGNTSDSDYASDIAVDTSGNVYITGYFYGTMNFSPGSGTTSITSVGPSDIFVIKMNSEGYVIWAKNMGGTGGESTFGLAVDIDGNVYITGAFAGTSDFDPGTGIFNLVSSGGNDIFISKLNNNGDFIWAKAMGGIFQDIGYSIVIDANHNVFVTGSFSSSADFDPDSGSTILTSAGIYDIFIMKLSENGGLAWAKGIGSDQWDEGRDIVLDSNGTVHITGFFAGTVDFDPDVVASFNLTSAGPFSPDIFISKFDNNGNFIWAKAMGGTGSDRSYGISIDANENIYTCGYFSTTNADFDPGPGVVNIPFQGNTDIFVSKLDADGNFVWAKSMGDWSLVDSGDDIAIDSSGHVYTTGVFGNSVDFDPGSGKYELTSAGEHDVFVLKLENDLGGPSVLSINRANPSPINTTSTEFNVTFSEPVKDVDINDFILTINGVVGADVTSVNGSGNTRTVTVNTGTGDGTIRLDIRDTASINDLVGNPLITSLPYTSGQTYDVDKTAPHVVDISHFSANPSSANSVDFFVVFPESVINVDVDDFSLTTTGVSGAAVTGVSSSGAGRRVTVSTGTGDGTIRLDVPNTATITDLAGNNITGLPYTTGATFTIDKSAAPTDIALSASSLTENLPAGTTIGTFSATDSDAGDSFTYSLVSGTGSDDNDAFSISGNTLKSAQAFNYLFKNSYSIRVRATDTGGLFYEEVFIISITNAAPIFADVPDSYWAVSFIERLYSAGITGGCGTNPLNYCPTGPVTRAQMAIFLEKGIHGSGFAPANVPATFTDTAGHWAEDWIEALKQDGITSGCGSGIYCPENPVTRAQMAVFLLKAKHGSSYLPPNVSATFGDTSGHWAEDWIEQLAAEGITSGCGGGNYCPENTVTRDQMAVFLVKAFNLP